jgi:hypothetical protein
MLLGGSLLQRVDRAVEARDEMHAALNQTQNNDLREDALAHLDVVLILLTAAMDVSARVAHRVLRLPGDERRAGWQNRRPGSWFDQIQVSAPKLADTVADGKLGGDTLTILSLLRNAVHGAALQGLGFTPRRGSEESLVGRPRADEAEVLDAMARLGGLDAWGVRRLQPGRTYIDPGVLVDRLMINTLALLNALMAETPVETLKHVALSPSDQLPPSPKDAGVLFTPWIMRSIRMQLGF